MDGVILTDRRVLVPATLRDDVLRALHAAHQGTSRMFSRAQSTVFWPGITAAIEKARDRCQKCWQMAPLATADAADASTRSHQTVSGYCCRLLCGARRQIPDHRGSFQRVAACRCFCKFIKGSCYPQCEFIRGVFGMGSRMGILVRRMRMLDG